MILFHHKIVVEPITCFSLCMISLSQPTTKWWNACALSCLLSGICFSIVSMPWSTSSWALWWPKHLLAHSAVKARRIAKIGSRIRWFACITTWSAPGVPCLCPKNETITSIVGLVGVSYVHRLRLLSVPLGDSAKEEPRSSASTRATTSTQTILWYHVLKCPLRLWNSNNKMSSF